MKNLFLAIALLASLISCASAAELPEPATYQIRNVKYLELLRPRNANNADGTAIVLYPAQPWKCMTWQLQPTEGSEFHLKNLFTSKTISATADTNASQQFVRQVPLLKKAGESPSWQFIKIAGGNYKIIDPKSGEALTAVKNDGEQEAKIVVSIWENRDDQKWILEKIDPQNLTM